MLRNSIDHGIETTEERRAAGKPLLGTIRLSARVAGLDTVIEIADDGRGLNRTLLLEKGLSKGLVAPDAVLSDREIYALIFAPGFSTAKAVTALSGRGVGMDVVMRAVTDLRGRIEIDTELGRGTVFRLVVPQHPKGG
jgi:two-component system chemotaxis sensor kinase CheA